MPDDMKVGEIVCLVSGSLPMTVEEILRNTAAVVWEHNGTMYRDKFATKMLKRMEITKGTVVGAEPNQDEDYDPA